GLIQREEPVLGELGPQEHERRQPRDRGQVKLGAYIGLEVGVNRQDDVVDDLPLEFLQQGPDQPRQIRLDGERLTNVGEHVARDRELAGNWSASGVEVLNDDVGPPWITR